MRLCLKPKHKLNICGKYNHITKSNIFGLDWFPMCNRSLKPLVMTRAILAPFLSRRALVATVVPIRIHSIRDESRGSSGEMGVP